MEKRICKLCNKSFSNGRALGGHMRSHMVTLQPLPPPPPPPVPPPPPAKAPLMIETTSSSSSYSSSEEEDKGLGYGLRENPKKSFRLVDPEFSFAVDAGSVVQDRESETESSKNPSRRRSKRTRKLVFNEEKKVPKYTKLNKVESVIEPEPMSSVSDTSPEEDVALCLMMLSRGTWRRKEKPVEEYEYEEEQEEDDDKSIEDSDDEDEMVSIKVAPNRGRGKYQCGTCKKVFKSYQALGGHRASHKKIKGCFTPSSSSHIHEVGSDNAAALVSKEIILVPDPRIHECPICFRAFKSGQALGGHKRSHVLGSATANTSNNKHTNSARFGDNLIDLNLPPVDDDDYSQVELSAVSDAEFVARIK